jgi:alpha-galactosidase
MTMQEAQTWADYNKLFGNIRLQSDNLMLLRPQRKALAKEVFAWPAMDETVPLDVWKHATDRSDSFELLLARKDGKIFLGVFNWGDAAKSFALSGFGLKEPLTLSGHRSTILTYRGSDSFDQLVEKLRSR